MNKTIRLFRLSRLLSCEESHHASESSVSVRLPRRPGYHTSTGLSHLQSYHAHIILKRTNSPRSPSSPSPTNFKPSTTTPWATTVQYALTHCIRPSFSLPPYSLPLDQVLNEVFGMDAESYVLRDNKTKKKIVEHLTNRVFLCAMKRGLWIAQNTV